MRRNKFSARVTGHVRYEAFHLRNIVLFDPRFNRGHIGGRHLGGIKITLWSVSPSTTGIDLVGRLTHKAPQAVKHAT